MNRLVATSICLCALVACGGDQTPTPSAPPPTTPAPPPAPPPSTTEPPTFASDAAEFLATCPTPSEVAAIDAELELVFISRAGSLACTESAGSVDLTVTQMGAYQTLRLMKAARFSEPLPWTELSLWDWLVAAIDGIEFDSTVADSSCCRGGNIVVASEGSSWSTAYHRPESLTLDAAAIAWTQLFVHMARHAEGPRHTCDGGSDQTFAEMGAWAYVYNTLLWFEQKFLPADFFSSEARGYMQQWRTGVCDRICGDDCPG